MHDKFTDHTTETTANTNTASPLEPFNSAICTADIGVMCASATNILP